MNYISLNLSATCILSLLLVLSPHLSQCQSIDQFGRFDWLLYKAVGEAEGNNVILSPVSVKLALAMLYIGAKGNTSQQLENILGLRNLQRSHSSLQHLSYILSVLQEESSNYDLNIGTKIFLDDSSDLKKDFNETVTKYFNASVEVVDFSQPAIASKAINKWAANITNGHIQELVSEADAKENIVLLLLNALYFKGVWSKTFPAAQTMTRAFHTTPKFSIPAEFMSSLQVQNYTDSSILDAAILRLPYVGDKFAMNIILPHRVDGLGKLINNLSLENLKQALSDLDETEVNIILPKFKFDFESSLKGPLQSMGLKDIFDNTADLSLISSTANLLVSNIKQKAGIVVNEKGSTAYAATQVDLTNKFGEPSMFFEANRPFLFLITDESTDTVVFIGKVVNPTLSKQIKVDRATEPTERPITNLPSYPNINYQPDVNLSPKGDKISGGQANKLSTKAESVVTPVYPVYPSQVESGYYSNNGELIKQNFDQERWSFFDTKLLQNLCEMEENKNFVTSPASIKTVLGMMYEGAADETERQIARLLRLPMSRTTSLRSLHSIQRELHTPPEDKSLHFIMSNRVLISAKLPTLPEYNNAMSTMYHGSVELAKFENPQETASSVNKWVSNVTHGLITTLLTPESVDKKTEMVLLNAVYFKGSWLFPFNKKLSQQQCFYLEDHSCKNVNMMSQRSFLKYGYYQQLLAHVIELPYSDTRFSMVLVIPEVDHSMKDLVNDLPHCPLLPFLNELYPKEVQLTMPSFEVEFSKELSEIISKIGAPSLFSDKADFRNMFGHKRGKLSKIIHKAKIIVNEKGSEAGAGTAGLIVPLMNSRVISLHIDRPFLFYIRDLKSGFLFMGQVSDPTQMS